MLGNLPTFFRLSAWLTAAAAGLSACGGGGGGGGAGGTDAVPTPVSYAVSGVAQKGPFAVGSSVQVAELDAGLKPSGKLYSVQTSDALGTYALAGGAAAQHVELTADGFYLDEVTGRLSASRVQLRAVADLAQSPTLAVNVLTTLQQGRLKALVAGGSSVAAATQQSQSEVLQALGVLPARVIGLGSFTAMRLNGSGDADAVLLAASALFGQMAADAAAASGSSAAAELSNLVNTLAAQLAAGGTITSPGFAAQRAAAAARLDLAAVRRHLQAHYAQSGVTLSAPKFEEWIDRSNAGVLPQRLLPVPALALPAVQASLPAQAITSPSITVSGLGAGVVVPVSVSAGVAITRNGVALVGTQAVAQDGDVLVFSTTSPDFGKSTAASVSVGGSAVSWTVSSPAYGGTVSGLTSSGLVLLNNGTEGIAVPAGSTQFALPTSATGSSYNLTVLTQPTAPLQFCTVANATGTVGTSTSAPVVSCVKVANLLLVTQTFPVQLSVYITHPSTGEMQPTASKSVPVGSGNPLLLKVDPLGRFAFVLNASGGSTGNSLSVYAIDQAKGSLTPVPGSPFAVVNRPTALELHPNGRFLYAPCDCAAVAEVFAVDAGTGALSPVAGAASALPANGLTTGRTFALDPKGRFAYVSAGGQLGVYAVDSSTGVLSAVAGSPFAAPVTSHGAIGIDPTGRFLYAVGPLIQGFTLDPVSGAPTSMPSGFVCDFTDGCGRLTFDPLGRYVYFGHWNLLSIGYAIHPITGALTSFQSAGMGGSDYFEITADGQQGYYTRARFPPYTLNSVAIDAQGKGTTSSVISTGPRGGTFYWAVGLVPLP